MRILGKLRFDHPQSEYIVRALQALVDKIGWWNGIYDGPHTEFTGLDTETIAARALDTLYKINIDRENNNET